MTQDDELREDGKFVIDYPGRKVCIYPNVSGQIVVMVEDFGERVHTALEYEEVTAVCSALLRVAAEAKPIADAINAEFGAHGAIEKAKGH